ncbi:hypothetical protein UYSO10_0697 [Kosakonia radicincitans]|nr:hypothetical protein UYSO10_0697 [Kosakonia radicincitans]
MIIFAFIYLLIIYQSKSDIIACQHCCYCFAEYQKLKSRK